MKKTSVIIAAALLAVGGTAQSQDQDEVQAQPEAESLEAVEEVTPEEQAEIDRMAEMQCRTSPVTGSRTRVNRTCMTRGEWRALQRGTRSDVDRMQGGATGGLDCQIDARGACT